MFLTASKRLCDRLVERTVADAATIESRLQGEDTGRLYERIQRHSSAYLSLRERRLHQAPQTLLPASAGGSQIVDDAFHFPQTGQG